MTSFEIENLFFDRDSIANVVKLDSRFSNWPVVYTLHGRSQVYVGETLNAEVRMRQHLDSPEKQQLERLKVILDNSFNKSVCLDLESFLIRLFSGDGQFEVLNRNIGITDADYYARTSYQRQFDEIFDALREQGLFSRSLPEIENSDLFKLSPFKSLTSDQASAVEDLLENFFNSDAGPKSETYIISGDPGTGKTVVGIYLLKLLSDIAAYDFDEPVDEDTIFSGLFRPDLVAIAKQLKVGLVVPQQSLRESIKRVFRSTPGLNPKQVMTVFEVGESDQVWDLLIVDESHRLNHRANQPSGPQNIKFRDINKKLFGIDDIAYTQLDWIRNRSRAQVLLLDPMQSVRPADLPLEVTQNLIAEARNFNNFYPLKSQMRIKATEDYVGYVRSILSGNQESQLSLSDYEFVLFENFSELYSELRAREEKFGLCRMLAGYAWPWLSNSDLKDPAEYDIELDGVRLKWNSTDKDWVNSPEAFNEIGSIHTIQGYDLNYAGVIIGPDLRYDRQTRTLYLDRSNYFDKKGKENNRKLGITYSDSDLLEFVTNIYGVLLSRGIRGTFVYVADDDLRNYLSRFVRKFARDLLS